MSYCPKCGKEILDETKPCPNCGESKAKKFKLIKKPKNVDKSKLKKIKSVVIKILIICIALIILAAGSICGYQIYCAKYINSNIPVWVAELNSEDVTKEQVEEISNAVYKYDINRFYCPRFPRVDFSKITASLCKENTYYYYQILTNCIYDMSCILDCYDAYQNESITDAIETEFRTINISEDGGEYNSSSFWKVNEMLSPYYDKYKEIMPKKEKVEAYASFSSSDNSLTITVTNNNAFSIRNVNVNYNFTFMYVSSSSYKGLEYYRDSVSGPVADEDTDEGIKGNSTDSFKFQLNPDDYYDSYGSYMYCELYSSNLEIVDVII